MTEEKKTRTRDLSLTVGAAFDRIRERLTTQADRELAHAREFLAAEAEWHGKLAARVSEKDRDTLARMLENTGAPKVAPTISGQIDEDEEEEETMGDGTFFAGGPTEGLGEPVVTVGGDRIKTGQYGASRLEEEQDLLAKLPRGTTEYVPGPAAQAARVKR